MLVGCVFSVISFLALIFLFFFFFPISLLMEEDATVSSLPPLLICFYTCQILIFLLSCSLFCTFSCATLHFFYVRVIFLIIVYDLLQHIKWLFMVFINLIIDIIAQEFELFWKIWCYN